MTRFSLSFCSVLLAILCALPVRAAEGALRLGWFGNSSGFERYDGGVFTGVSGGEWKVDLSAIHTVLREEDWRDAEKTSLELSASLGRAGGPRVELGAGAGVDSWSTRAQGRFFADTGSDSNLQAIAGWRRADLIDTIEPFGVQTYNTGASMGAWKRSVASDDASLYVRWSDTGGRIFCASKFLYGFLTDGNRRYDGMAEAGYMPIQAPGLKLFYTYALFGMKKPAPQAQSLKGPEDAYYDPKLLENHLLRAEYERALGGGVKAGSMAAVGYMPASGGKSAALFLFCEAGREEGLRVRADLRGYVHDRGVEREGDGGFYLATQTTLTLAGRF